MQLEHISLLRENLQTPPPPDLHFPPENLATCHDLTRTPFHEKFSAFLSLARQPFTILKSWQTDETTRYHHTRPTVRLFIIMWPYVTSNFSTFRLGLARGPISHPM